MELPTILYLIRHGESQGNVTPIVAGPKGDGGLTQRGVQQAERLQQRLAATREIKADRLLSSDLPRARQTAEIIAPALQQPVVTNPAFQEMHVGEADALNACEVEAKYGRSNLYENPFSRIAPGAENWGEFVLRIGMALHTLTNEYRGQTIVVVTHAGVIDAAMAYFSKLHTLAMPPVGSHLINTGMTHWKQEQPVRVPAWRLMGYNDHAHLLDWTWTHSTRCIPARQSD